MIDTRPRLQKPLTGWRPLRTRQALGRHFITAERLLQIYSPPRWHWRLSAEPHLMGWSRTSSLQSNGSSLAKIRLACGSKKVVIRNFYRLRYASTSAIVANLDLYRMGF